MLEISDFTCDTFDRAPQGSICYRSGHLDEILLRGVWQDEQCAIVLSGDNRFSIVSLFDLRAWCGVIVPSVRILVDVASRDDGRNISLECGTAIRHADSVGICGTGPLGEKATMAFGDGHRQVSVPIGFRRWSIFLGQPRSDKCLVEIDLDALVKVRFSLFSHDA